MTTLLSCGVPISLIANQVYAIPSIPCQVLSEAVIQFSSTFGGAYSDLAGSNVEPGKQVIGGFVKCVTGTNVVLKRHTAGVASVSAPFGGIVSIANLVSYWKLDEASGTRVDSKGTNHLTPTNAPVGAPGKIGNGCDFESTSSQYLSHPDPNPLGDEDFTYSLWFKRDVTNQTVELLAKVDTIANVSYKIEIVDFGALYFNMNGTLQFQIGTNYANTNWHFVVVWHDAAANTLNGHVDNGTVFSTGTGGAFPDSGPLFSVIIGCLNGPAKGNFFDGLIDEVGLWRRVLTAQERTDLYNGGNGRTY